MVPALSKEILNIQTTECRFTRELVRDMIIKYTQRIRCLTFSVLGFAFDNSFGPKNDYHFCLVFVIGRLMPNTICDLVLYFKSEGLNIP